MIIYNRTGLNNLLIQNETEQAHDAGLITTTEQQEINLKYPHGFYSPGIWIKIGLFILTCIIISSATGMLSLMFMQAQIVDSPGWILFLAALTYAGLELIVRGNAHYKSGVDNALILISTGLFLTGLCWVTFESLRWENSGILLVSAVMFVVCLLLTLRFADVLMAAAASIALLIFVFFSVYKMGAAGQTVLPFVLIICSGLLYFWANKAGTKRKAWYYGHSLVIVQIITLMGLYLSGNYFVVRTLNEFLNSSTGTTSPLPFSFFFWGWTAAVPLAYIGWGLKNKNVILLRCGLLLVAAAAFTIRTYFHLMSLEAVLCLTGAILIGIAYGVIRYLQVPKHGFTYEETAEKHLMDHIRIESLIIAETFSGTGTGHAENSKFGGGDFGGGGSSGNF